MAETRGLFIAFEGGEGAGKSTQARLLADALAARGITVVTTREPGGTPGAEALRALLLDPAHDWHPRAEALLFAAARSDHVEQLIRPALERGDWVVCDRYLDSSRAYQGGAGGIGDAAILDLHQIGSAGLLPDCTILIALDAREAGARTSERDGDHADRIGGKGADYHDAVRARFDAMAQADPDRFVRLSGSGEPHEVHAQVMMALAPWLERA